MPKPSPAATPPPARPPYRIPPRLLRAMALALPRPADDEPEAAWRDIVQGGLDQLGTLDPRNPIEAMLAVHVIAANAAVLDAFRLAFEPAATPSRRCASAPTPPRWPAPWPAPRGC